MIDLVKDLSNRTPTGVQHLAMHCIHMERTNSIADLIQCYGGKNKSTIVFVPTKKDCNNLMLTDKIKQEVQIIHGDINQKQREATIEGFRKGKFRCLVATDVASRGLDIPMVDLVIQSEPPKELDIYIHRAGRTARAGRFGICISLYTKREEELIGRIEKRAKIKFTKIGAPQKTDIINSNIRDITQNLESIDSTLIKLFEEPSKQLIETYGAENAIGRLLALVSGHTGKLKSRSILCGAEGFVTFIIKTTQKMNHVGYIWTILRKIFPTETTNQVKGMKQFANAEGCAFDVPEELSNHFEEVIKKDKFYNTNFTIERAVTLPECAEGGKMEYQGSQSSTNGGHFTRHGGSRDRRGKERKDVFIGNMPFRIDVDDVKKFLKSNRIDPETDIDIRIALDKDTGKQKGFVFVSCYEDTKFEQLLKLDGAMYQDRKLRINRADDKPSK